MAAVKEMSKSAFRKNLPTDLGQFTEPRADKCKSPLAICAVAREAMKATVIKSLKSSKSTSPQSQRSPLKPPLLDKRESSTDEEGKRVLERQYYSADVSAMIDREKYDHQAYIYGYKVSTCQAWLHGKCPKEDSECFDSHCNPPLRRKPHLQHGRFNYIPTRCRYLTEKEECPQTIHCRFAHCTEEVIYHPSKFRTQLCQHGLDSQGICEGYGYHCAKAHTESDLRPAVFETMDNPACLYMTMDELSDFVCTVEQQPEERMFYMFVYKTRRCEGYPYNCGCDGLDYHRGHERRRPGIIKYLPMACPNIKPFPKSEWGDPYDDFKCVPVSKPKKERKKRTSADDSADEEIWDCQYAHTLMEVMYHPQVYKTDLCQHFDENDPANWRCVWKKRCAHAHGTTDLRTKEEAVQEWKLHMGDAAKGRKLPSLVEQIIATPEKDNDSIQALSEDFSQRSIEDRKFGSTSSSSTTTPTAVAGRPAATGASKFSFDPSNPIASPAKTPHPAAAFNNPSGVNPILHNVHARQQINRMPARRTSLPSGTSVGAVQQQLQQLQQQQAMQHHVRSKSEQQLQQLLPQQQPPPPQQQQQQTKPPGKAAPPPPKQQLPPIPTKTEFLMSNNSSASEQGGKSGEESQQTAPPPPPPPPTASSSFPGYQPRVPPSPPVKRELFPADKPHFLSEYEARNANSLFPRGSSALDILEEIKNPPGEDAWKTPPQVTDSRPTGPKYSPLFDLGSSLWSSGQEPPKSKSSEDLLRDVPHTPVKNEKSRDSESKGNLVLVPIAELEGLITCPFPSDSGETHFFKDPVATPCCRLAFCRKCEDRYLAAVDGLTGWPLRCVQMKDRYNLGSEYLEREGGRCICGHWITAEQLALMSRGPNFFAACCLDLARQYVKGCGLE